MSNPQNPSEIPEDSDTKARSQSPGPRPDPGDIEFSELDAGLAAAYESSSEIQRGLESMWKQAAPGTVIAQKYRLIEQIGVGGMGTVWYAEQLTPVKRKVAVKLIKPGMDSAAVLARFDAERQALALMDHPNIAKVLDGGVTDSGHPYFVMELVRGTAITIYCDKHKLNLGERMQLFIPVCQAIQHAHQKGIIHRDIKPSNVMIALYDGKPVSKVIDFGVAKAQGPALTELTLYTGFGAVVGTPEYMSPEQAELNNIDIDTRSDVYSLGVLMYELLAGSPPFRRSELAEKGFQEILRIIREEVPPRPSAKLSTSAMRASIAAARSIEPAALGKVLRSDLDWIVLKSLEKDRSRRYDSANALVRDLERYLRDEPVEACPPSAIYKLRKLFRRYRIQFVAAALLLATLVAGVIGTTWGMFRADRSRRVAVLAEKAASDSAERERAAKTEALAQKANAEKAEDAALESYRASIDDAIEQSIGSKPSLGPQERA